MRYSLILVSCFLLIPCCDLKSQTILNTDEVGLKKLYSAFVSNNLEHNFMVIGEEHYKYENFSIEYRMAALMKDSLFTHHILEVDPITTLKIHLIISDSTINYPNKGNGSYLDNLAKIYKKLKIDQQRIVGIAPIEKIKPAFETLKFYAIKKGYNDSLLILLKKCKGFYLKKKFQKLMSFWYSNKFRYNDENLDYALHCLSDRLISNEMDRDKAISTNYLTFLRFFDSTTSFGFFGKLHVAKTKFKVENTEYNSFVSILNSYHNNLNIFSGIISYGIVDISNKEFSSSDFMKSYRIPCYFIDKNHIISVNCTNFIWFTHYSEIHIFK